MNGMGSNSFISHRMFVAALNGAESSHPSVPSGRVRVEVKSPNQSFSMHQTAGELAAQAAQHWLDFPFARGMERRAS